MKDSKIKAAAKTGAAAGYNSVLTGVAELLEAARRTSARATNAIMTATYWEIGRRIVEYEQKGQVRAEYGRQLVDRLAVDLTAKFGRGFKRSNLFQMKSFYLTYPEIVQTVSGQSSDIRQAVSPTPSLRNIADKFPLPWSHYIRLLSLQNPEARSFYETEALRAAGQYGSWSGRSIHSSMKGQLYPGTKLLCSERVLYLCRMTWLPLKKRLKTPLCSNSSGLRMSILKVILKRL